jgi:hypothetical protein
MARRGSKSRQIRHMMYLLNDVGHEGINRRFHTLAHALCIFSTGQVISPMDTKKVAQKNQHEQNRKAHHEDGPIRF